MALIGRFILGLAAALITLGGFYDLFAPRLPANLAALCGGNPQACTLVRELLRALGGSLVAIGLAVAMLTVQSNKGFSPQALALVLLLVIPSEGVNSFCMRRVGSPYYVPLGFALITVLGAALAWPHPS